MRCREGGRQTEGNGQREGSERGDRAGTCSSGVEDEEGIACSWILVVDRVQ